MRYSVVISTFAAASLLGSGLSGPHPSAVPEPAQQSADTYEISTNQAGHNLLTGHLRTAGAATAGTVSLVVWPTRDSLEDLAEEESVETFALSSVNVPPGGRFTISVNPDSIPAAYATPDGIYTFEARFMNSTTEIPSWFFSARHNTIMSPSRWISEQQVDSEAAAGLNSAIDITVDLMSSQGMGSIVQTGNEPENWVGEDGYTPLSPAEAKAAVEVGTAATPPANWACASWQATNNYDNNRPEKWVNSWGTIQGKPILIQEVGSSHSVGTAIKIGSGRWSANGGATSIKTTGFTSEVFRTYSGAVSNRINYRQYKKWCFDPYGSGTRYDYSWQPSSYHSYSTSHTYISRPDWNKNKSWCESTPRKNGHVTKQKGSNATFSSGVNLSVLSVSSQASFTANTKIKWEFSGNGALLCGSSASGPIPSSQAATFVP